MVGNFTHVLNLIENAGQFCCVKSTRWKGLVLIALQLVSSFVEV